MLRSRPLAPTASVLAVLAVTIVSASAVVAPVHAQGGSGAPADRGCLSDREPDDVPDQAQPVTGEACLSGTLPSGDQDLFVWEVSGADASSLWAFTLEGTLGVRTIADLRAVTSEPGVEPLAVGGPLLVLTVPADQVDAVARDGLLLSPGRYLVGVSAGGQADTPGEAYPLTTGVESSSGEESPDPGSDVAYTLTLAPGGAMPPSGDIEPNDDAGTASAVGGAFALSGDLEGSPDTYRWTIEAGTAAAWTLGATTQLGTSPRLTLATGDGSAVLAQTQGIDGRIDLPDLALPPADYLLTVDPPASAPTPYVIFTEATDTLLGDPEPNDTSDRAVPMSGEQPLARGRLGRSLDEDWYRFELDEGLATGTIDIRMLWRSGLRRELCLTDAAEVTLVCRAATDGLNISGLSLPAGPYWLRVRGDAEPEDVYLMRVDPAGTIAPDFEREPNDSPETATALAAGTTARGRSLGGDIDHFRVHVSGEPQLWQVDATGVGLTHLDWIRPGGEQLGSASVAEDGSDASLLDLYLTPGEHWLRVEAEGGDYTLGLTPLGPPDPNAEREPNDLPAREERLAVGRERVGRLPTATDTDVYRLSVRGPDHLLLRVDPPPDGVIDVLVQGGIGMSRRHSASAGEPVRDDLLLGPGDYRVTLMPITPSLGRYTINLTRLDPFTLADDQEPNDSAREARTFPMSGSVAGTAATATDTDWYALPPSADGAPLKIVAEGEITNLALGDGAYEQTLFAQADGVTYESGPLTPGAPLFLRVAANGPYELSLGDAEAGDDAGAAGSDGPPAAVLEAELALPDQTVAAWWPTGQRLAGTLELTNTGSTDVAVTLDALASDGAWHVVLPPEAALLAAASSIDVPLEIVAPRDVPADEPVRITVRASTPDGSQVTAAADIQPSREILPQDQLRTWPVPESLLGGLDVASLALGALPITSLDADGEERLHDGVVSTDWGLSYPIGGLPVILTVDLAGDEPVPVAGTIIQPFSEDPTLGDAARDFELALSMDGGTWETVLTGRLEPVSAEQSFVLDSPTDARYAQLRVVSGQRELPSRINLGEWKVIAEPGWSSPGGPVDLADPRAGGHVAWMTPQTASAAQAASLLDDDSTAQLLDIEAGAAVEWTLGFMDDRAALVSALEWRDAPVGDREARLGRVEVSTSTDSPLGPWRSLGAWTLERAPDGSVAPFVLAEPTWARFLRFRGSVGKKQTQVELPDRVRVLEAPGDAEYRSILGQWGMGSRDGPREWITAPVELVRDDEVDGQDDADGPRDLAEGRAASGRVHFGEDTDWYRFTVPDGRRSLALNVAGPLSVGAALRLETSQGEEIPMTFGPGDEPGSVTYRASVEPGASYLVEVSQPQSSIVVSFDSSASVATQLSAIESGLRALAEGMMADRESLRIVPFDNEPLLPDWSSDAYEVADAVNRFRLGASSSAVESNLREAALDLAAREGGRAVLLITDAASSSFDDTARLWAALATSRPQVFGVAVGGEGEVPAIVRHHLMADWAASAGGVSSQARGGEDIVQAFDRLATWLRRPVAYRLDLETFPEELPPPPPGRLFVQAPEVGGRRPAVLGGDGAIELVVDTSGSMRKRLGDLTRIEVAKRVLTDLVREDLPAGAPVALRMFPPPSDPCDSTLLTPLGPLEPPEMLATVGELSAPKKAQTPLARAIAAVADDLADVTGPRIVVVLSDGKESCKGDPEKEVERLRSQGFDVTLNVVGLALDKKSRKTIARLAELGGGSYFDASDPASLGAALRAAVSAPYEVRDGSGTVVGRSTVGGATLEVPTDRYEVVVLTDPLVTFNDVYLAPDADVVLTLPATDP